MTDFLRGREPVFKQGHYAIVESDLNDHVNFRVVNLQTGAESSLYSFHQCGEIIGLALRGELKGSFDLEKCDG